METGDLTLTATESATLSPRSSLAMREDHVVGMHHRIVAGDDFRSAAESIFALLRVAEERHPGGIRSLHLQIEGHEGERAGFDADFFEFQQEFMLGAMGQYLTWIEMPLTGKLGNPEPQDNQLPDQLLLQNPTPTGYTPPA